MFNKAERIISLRNLRPKKKEGFLKVISIFSFVGIMLGVAILIIVMSVMNGFKTDLTNKILGLNPHIIIKSFDSSVDESFKKELKDKFSNFKIKKSFNGEAIIITSELTKGVMVKGSDYNELEKNNFFGKYLIEGSYKNFSLNSVIIGKELAIDLDLEIGSKFSLMSSAFIETPIGSVPKQESFEVEGIFNTGFYEFDANIIFLNLKNSLSLFDKSDKDLDLEIFINNPIKADFYKKKIQELNNDYYVYSWTDLNKSFFSALKVERNVMFIILTLIIIVAAFNIISGLTILIKNKTKEIAILKTLGLSNVSITKTFFLTGFTIGFLASVAGVILGTIFSIYVEDIRYFLSNVLNLEIFPSDIYLLDELPSEINPASISIIFIFSLIITAIASFFPANLLSKMNTIKALKYE